MFPSPDKVLQCGNQCATHENNNCIIHGGASYRHSDGHASHPDDEEGPRWYSSSVATMADSGRGMGKEG